MSLNQSNKTINQSTNNLTNPPFFIFLSFIFIFYFLTNQSIYYSTNRLIHQIPDLSTKTQPISIPTNQPIP